MAEHPLLVLPAPVEAPREPGPARPILPTLRFPHGQRQGVRLNPEFQRLVREVDRRHLELRNSAVGALPDQVLVLETVGTVQNFVNAVRHVDGLQWLAEAELEDIEPDDDFFDDREGALISRRLFLVMTNAEALRTLNARFDAFQQDPDVRFPARLGASQTGIHSVEGNPVLGATGSTRGIWSVRSLEVFARARTGYRHAVVRG